MKKLILMLCIFWVLTGCSQKVDTPLKTTPSIVDESFSPDVKDVEKETLNPTSVASPAPEIQNETSQVVSPLSTPTYTNEHQIIGTPVPVPTKKPDTFQTPLPTARPAQKPIATKVPVPTKSATPVKTPVPTKSATPVKTPVPTKSATPVKTPVPTKSATPVKTPVPTISPKPTVAPQKSIYDYRFDAEAIRKECIAIGQEMGLRLDNSLNPHNSTWWNPVIASQNHQGTALKQDLESYVRFHTLDNLKHYGIDVIASFNIYYESVGNGEYIIYFLFV